MGSFTVINLCVASQRVFVIVYLVMTQSGNFWIHQRIYVINPCDIWKKNQTFRKNVIISILMLWFSYSMKMDAVGSFLQCNTGYDHRTPYLLSLASILTITMTLLTQKPQHHVPLVDVFKIYLRIEINTLSYIFVYF
jgi:hypothetical protein